MDADDGHFFEKCCSPKSQGQEASDQQTCGKVHCYGSSSSRIAELRGETMTASSPIPPQKDKRRNMDIYMQATNFLGVQNVSFQG